MIQQQQGDHYHHDLPADHHGHLTLFGRDAELARLDEWERGCSDIREGDDPSSPSKARALPPQRQVKQKSSLLVVQGTSGTGKSAVCQYWGRSRQLQQQSHNRNRIFVSGKFDQYNINNDSSGRDDTAAIALSTTTASSVTSSPSLFSALFVAFNELGESLATTLSNDTLKELQDALRGEGRLLVASAPGLKAIGTAITSSTAASTATATHAGNTDAGGSGPTNNNNGNDPEDVEDDTDRSEAGGAEQTANLLMASERLAISIRRFLKVLDRTFMKENQGQPHDDLIIFLDDIQWADDRTLQRLLDIVFEDDLQHIRMIWACRLPGEEERKEDRVGKAIRERVDGSYGTSASSLAGGSIPVADLPIFLTIHNLNRDQTHELVVGTLPGMHHNDEVRTLSNVVHAKTLGNPLAVHQFLKLLQAKELLIDHKNSHWSWKIQEIEQQPAASNVINLLTTRMETLPRNCKCILKLAACINGFIREDWLETMYEIPDIEQLEQGTTGTTITQPSMSASSSEVEAPAGETTQEQAHKTVNPPRQDFASALRRAEQEGLIQPVEPRVWRFSHDRVQESLYNLLPSGRARQILHKRLGQHFQSVYGDTQDRRTIYFIAEQYHRALPILINSTRTRITAMRWNLRAAQVADAQNATDSVLEYARGALAAVKEEDWIDSDLYHDLLQVHTMACKAEFAVGNFEAVRSNAAIVVSKSRSLNDTVAPRVQAMETLGAQLFFTDAILEARKILEALGEPLPRANLFNVIREDFAVKRLLKGKDDSFFANMQDMENPNTIWAMQILYVCSLYGWNCDPFEAALSYLRMMRLTLTHGKCSMTPMAMAGYVVLVADTGDDKTGYRFSKLASQAISHKSQIPSVYLLVHSSGSHLGAPVSASLEPSLSGYRAGLQYGDIISGTICMAVYSLAYMFCGLPLRTFISDAREFARQLKLLRQEIGLNFVLINYQVGLQLTGQTEELVSWDAFRQNPLASTIEPDPEAQATILILQMRLFQAVVLNDWEDADRTLQTLQTKKTQRMFGGHFINMLFALSESLLCVHRVKTRTAKRRHRKILRTNISWFRTRISKGNVNGVGMLQLILAEQSNEKQPQIQQRLLYNRAIASFSRSGFIHYNAIANELAGRRFLEKNKDQASLYLSRCLELYEEWGASRKAEMLRDEFEFLNDDDDDCLFSSSEQQANNSNTRSNDSMRRDQRLSSSSSSTRLLSNRHMSLIKGRQRFNPLKDDANAVLSVRNNSHNGDSATSSELL